MDEKEVKMTKREKYELLYSIVESTNVENKDILLAFVEKQINAEQKKSENAKLRAEKKRIAGDKLRATVKSILTEEYQTAEEIVNQIENEEVTKSKVIARLTQLINAGEAVKQEDKTKKCMSYKLA